MASHTTPPEVIRIAVPDGSAESSGTGLTPHLRATRTSSDPPALSIDAVRLGSSSGSSWHEMMAREESGALAPPGPAADELGAKKSPRLDGGPQPPAARHVKAQKVSGASDAATSGATQTGSAPGDDASGGENDDEEASAPASTPV